MRAPVPPLRSGRLRGLAAVPLLACALPARAPAQPRAPAAPAAPAVAPPVTLPSTHVHVLRSAVNGREYHVAVALPVGYQAGAEGARYPVLYLLDGGAHLPLFASMLRLTNRANRTGDVILVGVGYYPPGAFPVPVPGQVPPRNIDYSPPPFRAPGAADAYGAPVPPPRWPTGAPEFHRVLKEEIIPEVERRYRASGDRALHGHSLGGLFATYVLFEDPDLFSRYAIMSPAYAWDGGSMFLREAGFARRRTSLPKQIFFGAGGLEGAEMVGGMWRMVAAMCEGIEAGRYRGLRLAAEVFADEHHNSAAPFGRALKALYPPYPPDSAAGADPCRYR